MSQVYFHTKERTVGIGGRERYMFGDLCWRLTEGMLDIGPESCVLEERMPRYREMLSPGHYIARNYGGQFHRRILAEFARNLLTALRVEYGGQDGPLAWKGRRLESFALQLNTALVVGSDAVKLAARIHGQCEIHGWVAGEHRDWLASLIERGLADGVFTAKIGQGQHEWADAVALLKESDRSECVMSYSVCEQFPNARLASEVEPDLDEDAWHGRAPTSRWSSAMDGLRARGDGLQLQPDGWPGFRFRHRLSALDLAAEDWRARLDAWVERAAAAPQG